MSACATSMYWCTRAPTSSKSEFVILPFGFATKTKSCLIKSGKGAHQSMAGSVLLGENHMPPMPDLDASQLPM